MRKVLLAFIFLTLIFRCDSVSNKEKTDLDKQKELTNKLLESIKKLDKASEDLKEWGKEMDNYESEYDPKSDGLFVGDSIIKTLVDSI